MAAAIERAEQRRSMKVTPVKLPVAVRTMPAKYMNRVMNILSLIFM